MKKKYKVFKISRVFNYVEMVLSEIPETSILPSKESTYQPDMQRIAVPIPKTEEEKIAYDVISSIKKFAPGLTSSLEGRPQFLTSIIELMESFVSDSSPKTLFNKITIIFSLEDYKELGSPALDEIMEFTLTKSNERGILEHE